MWTKVFSLEKVILAIQKPQTVQDVKTPALFIGEINKTPTVFAFTDHEHFEIFRKVAAENKDPRELARHEVPLQEFLGFTLDMAFRGAPLLMMNFGCEFAFHTQMQEVQHMYNAFIKKETISKQKIPEGLPIEFGILPNLPEMKLELDSIKQNYLELIHRVFIVGVKIGQVENVMLVIDFTTGLSQQQKEATIQKLFEDLSIYQAFQTRVQISEDMKMVPDPIKNQVVVNFS
ncbi:hypothetical protein PP175_28320 (plasmid) [Aneurinibacillus sp. Ricciae_BoGa-3]|uniref:hypothetical protein n=1 Tax=Aneurinibacillus sp. Ricciae_BoGa-3 TaxID=3022697 RepID=UPI0023424D3A|nr:hypothetical protein [Aneurinibacillus sp. Ricciae_BoGa-3]WCK57097.1 hypothetical protein PP175_28320 [Aneurinibacillus sp. Ricciae_BoGa-3]